MASSQAKLLQHTTRGLRVIGGEKSLFDMKEPIWHPDEKSPGCDICKEKFSFVNRRHHCRRCGDVICGNCSEKQPLTRMGFVDPVLVCSRCAPACKTEDDFLKHHLKLLINGAYFQLSDTGQIYNCKLSHDHHMVIVSEDHDNIPMASVVEIRTNTSHSPEGANKMSSLQLTYHDDSMVERTVTLSPSPAHSRKQSLDWLKAFKKGLVILHGKEHRERRSCSLSGST